MALQKHAQQAGCLIVYLLLGIEIWIIIRDISFGVTGLGCALVFGFLRQGFSKPGTPRDPPASGSQVLGLKVCATTNWHGICILLLVIPTAEICYGPTDSQALS